MNDSSLKPSSSPSKALATSRPVHWAASPDNYSPTSGASFSRSDLDPAELGQGLPTTGWLPVVPTPPIETSSILPTSVPSTRSVVVPGSASISPDSFAKLPIFTKDQGLRLWPNQGMTPLAGLETAGPNSHLASGKEKAPQRTGCIPGQRSCLQRYQGGGRSRRSHCIHHSWQGILHLLPPFFLPFE